MNKKLLITGATGNMGRALTKHLELEAIPYRAASSSKRGDHFGVGVEQVELDLLDPKTWPSALAGCDRLFLLRPPAISDIKRTIGPFIDQAVLSGVEHIVFLSVAGAQDNKLIPHHKIEQRILSSGATYTFLRPGFFAQNLQDAYLKDLREDHRLYVPAGDGQVAFIDLEDVATIAAQALAAPSAHLNQAYTLTGPEAIGFEQVAARLSQALERPIRYESASILGYIHHLRARRQQPWGQAIVQTILHVGLRFGRASTVDPTLERLLGRPSRTITQYIQDNATRWR